MAQQPTLCPFRNPGPPSWICLQWAAPWRETFFIFPFTIRTRLSCVLLLQGSILHSHSQTLAHMVLSAQMSLSLPSPQGPCPFLCLVFLDLLSWGHFSFSCVLILFTLCCLRMIKFCLCTVVFYMSDLTPFWIVISIFSQRPTTKSLVEPLHADRAGAEDPLACGNGWRHTANSPVPHTCLFPRSGSNMVNCQEDGAIWFRQGTWYPKVISRERLALHPANETRFGLPFI